MRPRRTPEAGHVFTLPGGNEDNDLWVEVRDGAGAFDGVPVLVSAWELDEEERAAIAAGGLLELLVWGGGHPPVALTVGPSLADRKAASDG